MIEFIKNMIRDAVREEIEAIRKADEAQLKAAEHNRELEKMTGEAVIFCAKFEQGLKNTKYKYQGFENHFRGWSDEEKLHFHRAVESAKSQSKVFKDLFVVGLASAYEVDLGSGGNCHANDGEI